jgi:site-specific DNA-cytosine methylase
MRFDAQNDDGGLGHRDGVVRMGLDPVGVSESLASGFLACCRGDRVAGRVLGGAKSGDNGLSHLSTTDDGDVCGIHTSGFACSPGGCPGFTRPLNRGCPLRVLEFYCGIGGFSAAIPSNWEVAGAIDQNQLALEVYRNNFPHRTFSWNIVGLSADRLTPFAADFWWMSPPCTPFTVRGPRADVDDPRCESFLHLLDLIAEMKPKGIALENVPGFVGSRAQQRLFSTLGAAGYTWREVLLCPTRWGIPNRRRRYYLLASQEPLGAFRAPSVAASTVKDHLRAPSDDSLFIPEEVVERYEGALHLIDRDDPAAVTNCFTSAYGRSWVRSGSYLLEAGRVRRFAPQEIQSLLGFPDGFSFPDAIGGEKGWALVGNSLSVPAVRSILTALECVNE